MVLVFDNGKTKFIQQIRKVLFYAPGKNLLVIHNKFVFFEEMTSDERKPCVFLPGYRRGGWARLFVILAPNPARRGTNRRVQIPYPGQAGLDIDFIKTRFDPSTIPPKEPASRETP